MRTIEELLGSSAIYRIGWVLLHSLWQSAGVAVVLAVMLRRLRRAPAESRYLAACVALVMMVALPAATSGLLSPAPGPVDAVGSVAPARPPGATGGVALEIVTSGPQSSPRPAWLPPTHRSRALLSALVTAWTIGVAALSLRLLGGWLLLRRLSRNHARPLAGACDESLRRLAQALRIRRAVRLLESSLIRVPMVIGGLRPVILLPITALTGLPPRQLEALLAHELAHIRRHDYLVNLAQSAIEVLLFYHPGAWWASRVIRVEREHCCDDLAVRFCGDRLTYARALAAMEGLRSRRLFLSPAADGGPLLSRIRRILNPEVESMNPSPVVSLGAALLIGTVSLVVGASAQPSGGPAMPPRPQGEVRTDGQATPARDPRVRTVYVPVFRSTSFRRDIQLMLTEAVIKEIEERTKYKVVGSPDEADSILEGTIDCEEKNLVVEDPFNLPRRFSARIEATVRRAHNPPQESEQKAPPVIVRTTASFNPEVDQTSQSAFYRACQSLAKHIVDGMDQPGFSPPTEGTNPGISPGPDDRPLPQRDREMVPHPEQSVPAPLLPIPQGPRRVTRIFPRDGGPDFFVQTLKTDDVSITVIRGGVEIVSETNQYGIIDVSADSATIWRRVDTKVAGGIAVGANGEDIEDAGQPMEVFLEGDVVFLQDARKSAGKGDQKTFRCKRAYYDFRTGRFVGL